MISFQNHLRGPMFATGTMIMGEKGNKLPE